MKNKGKLRTAVAIAATFSLILTGCNVSDTSSSTETEVEGTVKGDKYVSQLIENMYYVRHVNDDGEIVCVPTYFGNATFDYGSIPSSPASNRILWYKEDFDSIPTLYPGDSLIMYTTSKIDEEITYERFEDYGYTIGICGLEELKSGRYKISTDKSDNNTYPYGDTDEILKLTNDEVILESISDVKTRATKDENADEKSKLLNRSGMIRNLQKDKTYKVVVYEGTVRHEYYFTADVRALGSMEVAKTYDYEFEEDDLLVAKIPEYFNSGYYMIDGLGLFRYVNNSETDFNIENNPDENDEIITQTEFNAAESIEPVDEPDDESIFKMMEPGEINVVVTFTIPGQYGEGDGLEDVTAIIETPTGRRVHMITKSDGTCERAFNAESEGVYRIKYYNLDIRKAHVTVTPQ